MAIPQNAADALPGQAAIPVTAVVTSVIPGTGPTNLGKAEDSVHASGDTGVAVWAVRTDSGQALASGGDYIPFITDAQGRLWTAGAAFPADTYNPAASPNGSRFVVAGGVDPASFELHPLWRLGQAVGDNPGIGLGFMGYVSDGSIPPAGVGTLDVPRIDSVSGGLLMSSFNPNAFGSQLGAVRGVDPSGSGANSILTIPDEAYTGATVSGAFTAAAQTSSTISVGAVKYFSLQVVASGAVTSWTVVLEGAVAGGTFGVIATHTNVTPGNGGIIVPTTPVPVSSFRLRCTAIVLGGGTGVTAFAIGLP